MDYEYILFDLDGTLTDSGKGIANSVLYALKKFGIEVEDRSKLYRFVGPPLLDSFERYYSMQEKDARKAIDYFHEYFVEKGIYENEVYSGIPQMLEELRRMGKKLGVATSKPEPFAVSVLQYFGLEGYFEFICGGPMDEGKSGKDRVIAAALGFCKVNDKSRIIMVGDREYDVYGARANGLDCIGVLYGYGSRNELVHAGAVRLADTVFDIPNCVL